MEGLERNGLVGFMGVDGGKSGEEFPTEAVEGRDEGFEERVEKWDGLGEGKVMSLITEVLPLWEGIKENSPPPKGGSWEGSGTRGVVSG